MQVDSTQDDKRNRHSISCGTFIRTLVNGEPTLLLTMWDGGFCRMKGGEIHKRGDSYDWDLLSDGRLYEEVDASEVMK